MPERATESAKPEIGQFIRTRRIRGLASDGECIYLLSDRPLGENETPEDFLNEHHHTFIGAETYEVATGTLIIDGKPVEYSTPDFNVARHYEEGIQLTADEVKIAGVRLGKNGSRITSFVFVGNKHYFPLGENDRVIQPTPVQKP